MNSRQMIAVALFGVAWLLTTSLARGDDIEEIVRSLSQRGEQITSLQIEWEGQTFKSALMKEPTENRTVDVTYDSAGKLLYDANGNFRYDSQFSSWDNDSRRMVPGERITLFDGKNVTKRRSSRGIFDVPSITKTPRGLHQLRDLRLIAIHLAYWPLRTEIGVAQAAKATKVEPAEMAGREHLIVHFDDVQIWVDPQREYLPVRYQYFTDGELSRSAELQYAPLNGTWQLSSWNILYLGSPDTVWTSHTGSVTLLTLNAPLNPEAFVLPPERGVFVKDNVNDERYLIRTSGEKRPVRSGEITRNNAQLLLHDQYWWPAVITAAFAVFVFIACVVFYLREQRRRATR